MQSWDGSWMKFGLLAICLTGISYSEAPVWSQEKTEQAARIEQPSINREFMDPNLDVEKFVQRFEVESREIFKERIAILKALNLQPGDVVADVGAGTGLFSLIFAEFVGERGWVFAVDISSQFLKHIRDRAGNERALNVTPVLSSDHSASLPPKSIDKMFVCDTYHHFEQFESMGQSMLSALKEDGDLFVIDFEKIPGKTRDWLMTHVRADKEQVKQELIAIGFEFVGEIEIPGFVENYMLRFKKPRSRP